MRRSTESRGPTATSPVPGDRSRRLLAGGTVVLLGILSVAVLALGAGGLGVGGDTGSGEDESTTPAVDLVGPDAFAARMDDPDVLIVNVHVPYEGEIAGTDLFVPFDEIARSDALPTDRDRPVALYCRSGSMSADAAADLVAMGYTDVTDLEGGMVAWEEAGRPIDVVADRADAAPSG